MLSVEQILVGLKVTVNTLRPAEILWHVYFAILIIFLILGKHLSKRTCGLNSRSFSLLLGIIGIFYGLTWLIQLGVVIDIILLIGVILIIIFSFIRSFRVPTNEEQIAK